VSSSSSETFPLTPFSKKIGARTRERERLSGGLAEAVRRQPDSIMGAGERRGGGDGRHDVALRDHFLARRPGVASGKRRQKVSLLLRPSLIRGLSPEPAFCRWPIPYPLETRSDVSRSPLGRGKRATMGT